MKISMTLDPTSIDAAIRQLESYRNGLEEKARLLCERLGAAGYDIASAGFGSALYDGTNDVSVELNNDGDNLVILASGETIMFIEFGTGVHQPDGYPADMKQKVSGLVERGQYGHGLGKFQSWRYPKSKGRGTGGEDDPKHPGYYITHGNPSNMAMYNASKDMRSQVVQIAREVFKT